MSDFDFRFVLRDQFARLADVTDERHQSSMADLYFVGQYDPSAALQAANGMVLALTALHRGAGSRDVLAASPTNAPLDRAILLQGAAFLDGLRADAWHAGDWEVFALALHLQDMLERRVRPADHEVVDFGGGQ